MRFLLLSFLTTTISVTAQAQSGEAINGTAPAEAVDPGSSRAKISLSSPDADIANRLRGLFAQISGLDQVKPEVNGGVVTLSGTTLTQDDREKAKEVASRLVGVVSVENDITIEHRVGRRVEPMIERADEMAKDIFAFVPLLALALVVFAVFWTVGWLLTRSTGFFGKVAPNPLVQTLVAQIVRLAFLLVGLIIAMRIVGATALLGSVLGAAGVLGLAIGFAVRDTIENYIASILLSIRRPFSPNDHVIIEGMEGRVTRLNSRATFLTSFDGSELRIPNAIVYKSIITNFTQIPQRRFEFSVGVGYENDLCKALATALSAVRTSDGVLAQPGPAVLIDSLDASTISVKVRGWANLHKSDFWKVRSEAIRSVKSAFNDQGISMPEPIQNVRRLSDTHAPPAPSRIQEEDRAEISDTSADRTIENKVDRVRSKESADDLLTAQAPRE